MAGMAGWNRRPGHLLHGHHSSRLAHAAAVHDRRIPMPARRGTRSSPPSHRFCLHVYCKRLARHSRPDKVSAAPGELPLWSYVALSFSACHLAFDHNSGHPLSHAKSTARKSSRVGVPSRLDVPKLQGLKGSKILWRTYPTVERRLEARLEVRMTRGLSFQLPPPALSLPLS